jgi:hypothetical protein
MTELSFLVDLLLNHRLPKATKDAVAARIKEVEQNLAPRSQAVAAPPRPLPPAVAMQSPSTQALMAKHGDIAPESVASPAAEVTQPAVIAQTPAAVAAINSRQAAIAASMSGNVDKVSGRPRKF